MPMYDYTCPACNKTQEKLVKLADTDTQKCDGCNGPLVREMLNTFVKHSSWTNWQVGLAVQRRR